MAAAKEEEKKAIMGCASSGHITKLNLLLPFNIYGTKMVIVGNSGKTFNL
jgi:hypothetical protein